MSMNRTEIAQQFQTLAEGMANLPQEQLTNLVLSSCTYLLEQLENGDKPLSQLDKLEYSELMSGYAQISDCVDRFAKAVRDQMGYETITQLHENIIMDLASESERAKQMQDAIQKMKVEQQQTELMLDGYAREIEDLEAIRQNQQQRLIQCNAEVVENLRSQNADAEIELGKLEKQLTEETRKQAEQVARKTGLENAISQFSQEQRTLLDEVIEKETYLDRLKNLNEECSPEHQAELTQQIEDLNPRVTKLETDTNKLREILNTLKSGQTHYETETETLSTDILTLIHDAMAELHEILPQHREALNEIKACADEMENSLAECKKIATDYRSWFEQDKRPLDAWKQAIQAPEYAQLKDVMDLKTCKTITNLSTTVEDALTQMDALLVKCTKAIRQDQKVIEKKANGR